MKDYYEDIDYIYVVLAFIKGRNLYDYLEFRVTMISEARVKEIAYHVLLGIEHLHSLGIVHRDLKLDNIVMTDNTNSSLPIIVDFGLATVLGPG